MENINLTERLKQAIEHILKNFPTQEMLKINRQNRIGMIIEFPPIETIEKYDITSWLTFQKYNDTIQRFEHTLREKFSHCDTSIFYKNLKELKLLPETGKTNKLEKMLNPKTAGTFFLNANKIKIYGYDNKDSYLDEQKLNEDILTHELLHMSTNRSDEFIDFIGFEQNLAWKSIGYSLNEGYTEYLNCKYFAHFSNSQAYAMEKYFAEGIEMIVGTEQMEKYYFASDLKSVIISLSQYRKPNEVIELITKMDKASKPRTLATKKKLFDEVKEEITNIYIDKQKKELEENKITKKEYEKNTKFVAANYNNKMLVLEKRVHNKGELDNVSYDRLKNKTNYQSPEMNIELETMLKPEQSKKSSLKRYK